MPDLLSKGLKQLLLKKIRRLAYLRLYSELREVGSCTILTLGWDAGRLGLYINFFHK